jgi:hypothetical protein
METHTAERNRSVTTTCVTRGVYCRVCTADSAWAGDLSIHDTLTSFGANYCVHCQAACCTSVTTSANAFGGKQGIIDAQKTYSQVTV